MLVVGLTGGIASGKSTVGKILRHEFAVPFFDADKTAHKLLEPDGEAFATVKNKFIYELNFDILASDGSIDRKKLGAIVFSRRELLDFLESSIHDLVERQMREFIELARSQNAWAAVADVPLLIEKGWHKKVDKVWLVYLSENVQLQRLCARDKISEKEARTRLDAQISLADKVKYADLVIDNSGTFKQTREKVKRDWESLRGKE